MSTETNWVYRVDEPRGSAGQHSYGDDPERWRGTITSAHPAEGAQHAAALVVTHLITEWDREGCKPAAVPHVLVWEGVREARRTSPSAETGRTSAEGDSGTWDWSQVWRCGALRMPPLGLLRPPSAHVRATARTSYPGGSSHRNLLREESARRGLGSGQIPGFGQLRQRVLGAAQRDAAVTGTVGKDSGTGGQAGLDQDAHGDLGSAVFVDLHFGGFAQHGASLPL